MKPDPAKKQNPHHHDETVFIGELQKFTDPPGGAPLDDPEIMARQRRGRPNREGQLDRQQSSEKKD